ncbi:MAG: LytR C-terminal domain-containing protein [Sciscionella sp.]
MTSPTKRRPLPALVFLLALTLLAALVWWRVLHRDSEHTAAATPTCKTTQAPKQLPEPAAVTLTVVNSTKRQGLAGKARKALLKDGFQIPGPAINDEKSLGYHGVIPQVAEIRHGPLGASGAQLVAYYLPGAKMVTSKAKDSTVIVALGTKFKAPVAEARVASALKADGITLKRTTGAPDTGESSSASC